MLTTTSNYNTENAKTSHDFCALIQFTGIADPQFCSHTFGDIDSTYKKLISNISYESPEYIPGEALLTRAKLTFTLIDKDEAVIDLLGGNIVLGKEVTCKFGYQSLNEADFVTLPTFYVKYYNVESDLISHTFICEETDEFDMIYNGTTYFITNETYTSNDETAASTQIEVPSTTGFIDPAAVPAGVECAAVMIGDEIIKYAVLNAGTDIDTCTRGYLGTTAQIHSQGAIVKPCYIMNESFTQVLMRILTTGPGTNGRYDSGITDFGPREQFSEALIDDEQMEIEGWRFHAAHENSSVANIQDEKFHYVMFEEKSIKEIINELFKPFHAVLYKNTSGLLSCKVMDLAKIIQESSSTNTLDNNNCVLNSIEVLDELMMTDGIYRHDWDYGSDKYLRNQNDSDITKNDESDTAYGTYPKREITNKGLDYDITAGNLSRFYHSYERFILFYGNMFTKLNVSPLFRKWLYEALDDIQIDSSYWPNYRDSNRTWLNEECTILKKYVSYSAPNQFDVIYDILNYYNIKKATSLYTLDQYDGDDGGFDSYRTAVQVSATNDISLEAEDGHGSWASNESGVDYVYVQLAIVIGAGADTESYIDVVVRTQKFDSVFSDIGRNTTRIKYNGSWNKTINVWCPCLSINSSDPILRMKVDWIASSGVSPDSVTILQWYVLKESWWTA